MTGGKSSDRRTFLKSAGVLTGAGAASGLSGCLGGGDGGSDDGGQETTTTTSEGTTATSTTTRETSRGDQATREEYGLPALDYEVGDTLNIFQWTDYWPSDTVGIFEKAYGIDVNVSNYASNEEMFNKLQAGGTSQFDLVFPSDYMINIMTNQGMLQPLDMEKLSHWDNLETMWREEAPYDPGDERYSAPYQWGTSGVGWNTNATSDVDGTSWDALWNEAYSGQITMLNDMRETIGASLKRLGYSLNSESESEIQEAKEALVQQKDLLLTYDSVNMAENLINEQASPIHTWSGDAFVAYWELWADGSSPIQYRIPDEGGVVWVDTGAVTKEAKNPNGAHAFINFFLNAKIQAEIANYVYYGSPNEAAKEYIDEGALNNPAIYPPESTMKKLEFIRNLGQATTLYSEAWTEIQNA